MKSTHSLIAAFAAGTVLFCAADGGAAELLINGNFEIFNAGGQPIGWNYTQGDSPNSNIRFTDTMPIAQHIHTSMHLYDYPESFNSVKTGHLCPARRNDDAVAVPKFRRADTRHVQL